MYCQDERYALVPGVRLRPLPEMGVCFAYTPALPALHRLNATAWLIVSLCDGRPFAALAASYRDALGGTVEPDASEAELRDGIARLRSLGILCVAPPSNTGPNGREP